MMTSYCSGLCLNRILSQSLVVGALTAIGLLSGLTPGLSKNFDTLVIGASVYAQPAVTNQEVRSYAQAVLAMEGVRQVAYDEIKKLLGSSSVPEIVCNRPETINSLPGDAQTLARTYCRQSSAIVANYFPKGKNARFNEITSLMQENPGLQARIKNELLRLQK